MGGFDRQAAAALYGGADAGDWFSGARRASRAAWLVSDWPGRKTEEWKYTSLDALESGSWLRVPPHASGGVDHRIAGLEADYLVFRNGRFDAEASRAEIDEPARNEPPIEPDTSSARNSRLPVGSTLANASSNARSRASTSAGTGVHVSFPLSPLPRL